MDTKKVIMITDCADVAHIEMELIIEEESKKRGINDVEFKLVPIEEFSILNAAFLTRLLAEECQPWTVLSVVINPQRHRSARIYGEFLNGVRFFGANTWALTWAINDLWVKNLYEIHDPWFITFWWKFVHAPNIAKILADCPFDDFWKSFPIESLQKLDLNEWSIVHIDNFWLMKIFGNPISFNDGQKFKIYKNWEYILDAVFAPRMMSLEDDVRCLYAWSSLNLPELWQVRNKYWYKKIDAKIWDIITWELIS